MDFDEWKQFEKKCLSCDKCHLHLDRKNVVIGRGNPETARIILIGEGPGEQEDLTGEAFVGRAGKLLDLLLAALEFNMADIYLTDVVKCRTPKDREPEEQEMTTCLPWLRYQVKAIRPSILVCLGQIAAQRIIDKNLDMTKMRGNWVEKNGFMIMPTWHPAAVLLDESKKRDLYLDMQLVKKRDSITNQS